MSLPKRDFPASWDRVPLRLERQITEELASRERIGKSVSSSFPVGRQSQRLAGNEMRQRAILRSTAATPASPRRPRLPAAAVDAKKPLRVIPRRATDATSVRNAAQTCCCESRLTPIQADPMFWSFSMQPRRRPPPPETKSRLGRIPSRRGRRGFPGRCARRFPADRPRLRVRRPPATCWKSGQPSRFPARRAPPSAGPLRAPRGPCRK